MKDEKKGTPHLIAQKIKLKLEKGKTKKWEMENGALGNDFNSLGYFVRQRKGEI